LTSNPFSLFGIIAAFIAAFFVARHLLCMRQPCSLWLRHRPPRPRGPAHEPRHPTNPPTHTLRASGQSVHLPGLHWCAQGGGHHDLHGWPGPLPEQYFHRAVVAQPKIRSSLSAWVDGRLWLNDGSCVWLLPEYRYHVWSYEFIHHRTDDGTAFRTLNILDEYSRECLAIRVNRQLNSTDVIDVLTDLFI